MSYVTGGATLPFSAMLGLFTPQNTMNTLQAQLTILMDDAGCIPYTIASAVAGYHSLNSEFLCEYGDRDCWEDGESLGIDLGEFLVWLGY